MSKGSARRPGDIKPGAWEAIFANAAANTDFMRRESFVGIIGSFSREEVFEPTKENPADAESAEGGAVLGSSVAQTDWSAS